MALTNLKQQKLLAINFGGIGDEVLFLPMLKTIRETFPETHVTLLLEPRSRSVEELTQLIDEVITFDIKKRPLLVSDLLMLVSLIKAGGYKTVISSGSSPLVSILLFLSGIPTRIGYDSGVLSRTLLTNPVALNRNQYAANMYHDLVQGLGLKSQAAIPSLLAPNLQAMTKLLHNWEHTTQQHKAMRVLIHPGTSLLAIKKGIIKTWSANSWASLIQKLITQSKVEVILAGGPDDTIVINEIIERLASTNVAPYLIPAYGATKTLGDLAALIQLSDLLVCVDSAPMHIAVGLGKPLIALFGPTDHNKLLPKEPKFIALASQSKESSNEAGVQLDVDLVYQTVLKQLEKIKSIIQSS